MGPATSSTRPSLAQLQSASNGNLSSQQEMNAWRRPPQQQQQHQQHQPQHQPQHFRFGPDLDGTTGGGLGGGVGGGVGGTGRQYQSPKSPSARIMQARQVQSMQLPPEDWADELAGVNGQLIESLEELAQR